MVSNSYRKTMSDLLTERRGVSASIVLSLELKRPSAGMSSGGEVRVKLTDDERRAVAEVLNPVSEKQGRTRSFRVRKLFRPFLFVDKSDSWREMQSHKASSPSE